jgi:hypothetical protein
MVLGASFASYVVIVKTQILYSSYKCYKLLHG